MKDGDEKRARRWRAAFKVMDCFVAALLAMTGSGRSEALARGV